MIAGTNAYRILATITGFSAGAVAGLGGIVTPCSCEFGNQCAFCDYSRPTPINPVAFRRVLRAHHHNRHKAKRNRR